MRVACFVHGRGAGHASRAREAVAALEARGHTVHLFAAGRAAELLADLPLTVVGLCAPGRGMPAAFARRLAHDLAALRELRPAVVLSDGDAPSVHAAALLRIPSVAVGHGLLFHHAELPIPVPPAIRLYERFNAGSSSWPAARRVVPHFAPVRARTAGTTIARPDLRADLDPDAPTEDFVLTYFRDDDGEAVLRALVARGERVVCFGRGPVPPGVEAHAPSAASFAHHLSRCRAVIASAGNHLPAEAVMLGKPLLALYGRRDGEQRMNGELFRAAGFGLAAPLDAVDRALLDRWAALRPPDPAPLLAMPPASLAIADAIDDALADAMGHTIHRGARPHAVRAHR